MMVEVVKTGIDVFEETEKFRIFQEKVRQLEIKRNQIEKNLRELNSYLMPFSVRTKTININERNHFSVTRKTICFSNSNLTTHLYYIDSLDFFVKLNEIDTSYIRQLSLVVRKQIRDYLYPYLLEGMKLKNNVVIEEIVPPEPIKIFSYSDEFKTLNVDRLKVENTDLCLMDTSAHITELPFKWVLNQTINALAIAQQCPEIFNFYKKGLDYYESVLDYDFSILKNMERIISPFVIAKRMGRKE